MAEYEHLYDDMELFYEELRNYKSFRNYEYVRCSQMARR